MKAALASLVIVTLLGSNALAQKRKGSRAPSRGRPAPRAGASRDANSTAPRIIGSAVAIMTKDGTRIVGQVVDINPYSIRIRSDNLESSIALDTVASLSFGSTSASAARPDQPNAAARPEFARDADATLDMFQKIAADLKAGTDYTEYGRELADLRRPAERFIGKYSASDSQAETRAAALVAGALTDYTWARTIWTLKFGRSSDGTVGENDSPVVTDVLALYPDLRAVAAAGARLSVDKIVSGLWRKAAEKTDRARSTTASR